MKLEDVISFQFLEVRESTTHNSKLKQKKRKLKLKLKAIDSKSAEFTVSSTVEILYKFNRQHSTLNTYISQYDEKQYYYKI